MSRILIVLGALLLVVGVVACGGGDDDGADTGADVEGTSEVAGGEETEEAGAVGESAGDPVAGQQTAQSAGCLACHSVDGSALVGPTWKGLFGAEAPLASGETVVVDAEYIRNSIRKPNEQIHEGFPPSMPAFSETQLSDEDVQDIIAYIETLR